MRRGVPLSETVELTPRSSVVNLLQMIPHYSYVNPLLNYFLLFKKIYLLFALYLASSNILLFLQISNSLLHVFILYVLRENNIVKFNKAEIIFRNCTKHNFFIQVITNSYIIIHETITYN